MDRRVKERLIGASILVVLIVLIVPELLSGPAPVAEGPRLPVSTPEPVRNVTVDLATRQAPVPDAVATAPTEPPAASGGATVPPAVAAPAPPKAEPPAPLESAVPAPTSVPAGKPATVAHSSWAVQLGSFASQANADKLARRLKAEGFAVYVLPGGSGSSARYRVRIGPMADRAAAGQAIAKLKSQRYAASLVPPAS
jgi:DedD protein